MASGWDWDALTEGATDTYADIDSLERIKPPDPFNKKGESRFPQGYPAFGTPNWWALRRRYEILMDRKQRETRQQFPPTTQAERDRAREDHELGKVAAMVALGSEAATRRYEEINPETGLHVLESHAVRTMRCNDPERYERLCTEALKLQAIGKPRRLPLAPRL